MLPSQRLAAGRAARWRSAANSSHAKFFRQMHLPKRTLVYGIATTPHTGLGKLLDGDSSSSTILNSISMSSRSLCTSPPQHLPRLRKLDKMLAEDEKGEGEEQEQEQEQDVENQDEHRKETQESGFKSESSGSSSGARSAAGGAGAAGSGSSSGGAGSSSSSSSGSGSGNSVARSTVPSVYPQVLALPITRRPLFPGFYKAVVIKNQAVCAAIKESLKRGQPYIGAFLLKDEEEDADIITDLSKVHKVGVFAQVTSVFPVQGGGQSGGSKKGKDGENKAEDEEGITAVLYPHRRIRIDELITPTGQTIPSPPPGTEGAGPANPISDEAANEAVKAASFAKVHEIQQEARGEGLLPEVNDASAAHMQQNAPPSPPAPVQGEAGSEADGAAADGQDMPSHSAPFQTSFLQDYAVSLVNVTNLAAAPYDKRNDQYIRAVMSELISVFKDIAQLNPLFRDQIANFSISQGAGNVFEEPEKLADFAAAVSTGEIGELQAVLEALDIRERLQKALVVLKKELMNAQLQSKISKDVESKIQKRQREYYLMEQLKGIKKELGIESDGKDKMVEKFREKAGELNMPEAVRKVFDEELNKLQTLEPAASEFNVTRGYLDWLTSIPWGVHSPENYSISNATGVLDEDHYGLSDVKDRILEFLAVGKLKGTVEGKIICLVGPPGVGKTSIGKSIARAVERQFFRFSVGGLSDVAEIKGHRRTYVGAMPGKAIQALKKVGTENPLILIDEVDKIGRGHNGDPSSALLEMLDPEQNGSFLDHYMDVPVDLSRVLFVCTANTLDTIPQPLLDRMEVMEVSSYTADEKRHIARGYLAPQAKEASGLQDANIELPDETIDFLIKHHARESGVRGLRKLLEKVYRKIAFDIVKQHGERVFPEPQEGELASAKTQAASTSAAGTADSITQSVIPPPVDGQAQRSDAPSPFTEPSASSDAAPDSQPKSEGNVPGKEAAPEAPAKVTTEKRQPMAVPKDVKVVITIDSLRKYLGPPVYHKDRLYTSAMPAGVSTGLGYLGNGSGSLMPIETTIMPGKGGLQLTGKLGDVIKESASIALSWMKTNAYDLGIVKDANVSLLENKDVHLHMPEGAIGKEGPSAGVAFTVSLTSLLTNRSVAPTLAMTGEVSLRGMVLPVGGLKEKLLAAHRAGITKVILPAQNQPNVEADVPKAVLDDLEVHYVNNVWSALNHAFGEGPWSAKAKQMEELERQESAQSPTAPKEKIMEDDGASQDQPVN
ncbi:probable PIM1 - ATP-dependent protease, mitochondrial [Melanopsichium pennsylvanicum]|uniref:Lon protease homolog, mitochondrial n=2 Tax=Melanopsichium pennsylvanicum TaxID=63383 RepID=A0AAJ4XHL1_9BASI|nr:probable PIM1-ATP-dependent protease, mitochondrial [Melanopsichium pennsylvanicum 4]SNX82447.1 probable PIM1 - ATP-dependent protease, mitochondrial [Melanopsichium pennsylvanicum]